MPNNEENHQALGADAGYGPFNHFLIGVGGTGGRVVREFRKKMVTRRGNLNPPDGVKLAYLNVDSSTADLREMDRDWRVMNQSVALDPSEQFHISEVNVDQILGDISGRPGIRPWLGDIGAVKRIVGHIGAGVGAQQIRRLGRILFAASAAEFRRTVEEKTRRLAEGGVQKVQFHLCASLAQGTGSGCIVDMVATIRKSYPNGTEHPIFLYLFVTDVTGKEGNFYSNQYAALQELNALELGIFHPHLLDEGIEDRHAFRSPFFNMCFLVSDKNEDGHVSGIAEQEKLAADFLYEKIVEMANNIPDRIRKAHTLEDYDVPNELGERCFNFGTFGIKALSVPNIEVEEKIRYSYCENALNQLLYNVFIDRKGFSDDTAIANYAELVSRPADLEGWGATVAHLTERFELPGDPPFDSIEEDWKRLIDTQVEEIATRSQAGSERPRWADMLYKAVNDHYRSHFRELGVESYYKRKAAPGQMKLYATEVVRRFERGLIDNWLKDTALEGGKHLYSLKSMLELAEKFKEELNVKVRKDLKDTFEEESDLEEAAEPVERRDRTRFQNRGWLSRVSVSSQTKALQAYGRTLHRLYSSKTTAKAISIFGNDCLDEIVRGIGDLENSIRKFQAWFVKEAETMHIEAEARLDRANGQASVGKITGIDQRNIRYLDESAVEETMSRGMLGNEVLARAFSDKVRKRIRELFHTESKDPLSFAKLSEYLEKPDGGLRDILLDTAKDHAKQDHGNATTNSNLAPIMGLHIVDELFKDYNGEVNGSLREVVKSIMEKAKASLKIDGGQVNPMDTFGIELDKTQPQRSFVVFLPTCRAHSAFRRDLATAFQGAVTGAANVQVVDVPEDVNCSDITIVTNTFWFSPRFIDIAKVLKSRYLTAIGNGENDNRWKLYLESHRAGSLPDLLLPDDREKVNLSRANLLLADILGKLESYVDDQEFEHLRYVERRADGTLLQEVDADTGKVSYGGTIDFGLEVTGEHREAVADHSTEGLPFTVAHAVFLRDFERRFKPTSYFLLRSKIAGLVKESCKQRKSREEMLEKLDAYRKTFFEARKRELGRAPDNDEIFQKWAVAVEVAKQQVQSAAP